MLEQAERLTTEPPSGLRLQGVDHLALNTDDMRKTMRFYTQVLGMRLVHVRRVPRAADRGQPPYDNLRHYFFDMGNGSLLAFFEYPPDAPAGNRDALGTMQHVAFHANRATFERFQDHFRQLGIPFAGPVYLGDRFWSIYVFDPNGIRLEITTDIRVDDFDGVDTVRQTAEEARAELLTLCEDPAEVDAILATMPLREEDKGT
jgi:catechol 2,3-dioxygenase-like lactoylglutathione lyase family enzyme